MQLINIKYNEIIKNIKKLKEKKYRDQTGEYIIEGIKLVQEAINENAKISKIVVCEVCEADGGIPKDLMYEIAKYDCIYVSKKIFEAISDVNTPQGILAVIKKCSEMPQQEILYNEDIIVVLDGVQDPGNLGTILRTVDSVNLKQIILSQKCADPYNPKVVRSTMGAIFRLNIIESKNIVETIKDIKKNKYKILTTSLEANESIYTANLNKKAIIIGNEANGVSKEVLEMANEKVKIPMLGKTESLNVSVATGVILYEYVRRKME